jgi:hypothetical protein
MNRQAKGGLMAKSVSDPPIRVFHDGEYWRVDYGSYMDGFHATRAEATAKATLAATREHRELEIEATD